MRRNFVSHGNGNGMAWHKIDEGHNDGGVFVVFVQKANDHSICSLRFIHVSSILLSHHLYIAHIQNLSKF